MRQCVVIAGAGACMVVLALGQLDVGASSPTASTGASSPPPVGTALAEAHVAGDVIGPDVIVGDIPETVWWATNDEETAYSFATTSCNVGDMNLSWEQAPSILHPVIGQNMYRLTADGMRFEQIGQSWLKHGFCALQLDLPGCGECPNSPGCLQHLEPGCSDPYDANRNGTQIGLGPKWQVNPHTGEFQIPWDQGEGTGGSFRRRLRVQNTDLDDSFSPFVKYFLEAQYVTQDDAAWGNGNNNASYRRVLVDSIAYGLTLSGPTHMQAPGIQAWQDNTTGVTLVHVQVPDDGQFIVGYKVVETTPGTWAYEYAVFNMNADRAGSGFEVPVPDGVTVTDMGFHDVGYHSGEPWDGTDWTMANDVGAVSWDTEPYDANVNANALRWGTLYNYRFTADAPPGPATATLRLFKPGTPTSMAVAVQGPSLGGTCAEDVDGNGGVGFRDILAVLAAWGDCAGCPEDVSGDDVVDGGDLDAVLAAWGPCP